MKEDGQYSQGQLIDHLRMESSLWKARAENAEAELSTKSLQCERHKEARYQIEQECMKLTKENHDLKAEVERVNKERKNIAKGAECNSRVMQNLATTHHLYGKFMSYKIGKDWHEKFIEWKAQQGEEPQ